MYVIRYNAKYVAEVDTTSGSFTMMLMDKCCRVFTLDELDLVMTAIHFTKLNPDDFTVLSLEVFSEVVLNKQRLDTLQLSLNFPLSNN